MKKIMLVLIFILIFITGLIIAEGFSKFELIKGRNEISLNYSLGYASDMARAHPEIETITYVEGNETIGYVNIFGGVGKDFIIEADKIYEINSNKNTTIYLR
jgi:hypothetical protein